MVKTYKKRFSWCSGFAIHLIRKKENSPVQNLEKKNKMQSKTGAKK